MKKWLLGLFMLSVMSSNVMADDPPNPQMGVPGVHAGDIISPITDAQISSWCDFAKQIIRSPQGFLCAYIGPKGNSVVTS